AVDAFPENVEDNSVAFIQVSLGRAADVVKCPNRSVVPVEPVLAVQGNRALVVVPTGAYAVNSGLGIDVDNKACGLLCGGGKSQPPIKRDVARMIVILIARRDMPGNASDTSICAVRAISDGAV